MTDKIDAIVVPRGIEGSIRPDGTFIGFDFRAQAWIDTSPSATRDLARPVGSASNPKRALPRSRGPEPAAKARKPARF